MSFDLKGEQSALPTMIATEVENIQQVQNRVADYALLIYSNVPEMKVHLIKVYKDLQSAKNKLLAIMPEGIR